MEGEGMMIATMLNLSRSDCKILKIKDIYSLHKVVYSLFPKQNQGGRHFLFVDKGGDFWGRRILILSKKAPLTPQLGSIITKSVPESFLEMDNYGFEIVMNPVKKNIRNGKIEPIRGRENLQEWFKKKSLGCGFEVHDQSLQVSHIKVVTYMKNGTMCTHGSSTFKGKLKVIHRGDFIKHFENGMGRAKAFGFGLLQLVPLTVNSK